MHQICDGYNPRVRMGNWFEESYSVPQPARTNPVKQSRESEIDIGYLDAQLKLRPLNRMARLPHWNTSGLVEAPQYSQYHAQPTTKENYDISTTNHYFKNWQPYLHQKGDNTPTGQYTRLNKYQKEHKVFNEHNVSELLNDRSADCLSFKSQLVPSKHPSQKALLQTTYQKEIAQYATQTNQGSSCSQSLTPSLSNFRRIRSEITLKNVPPFQTYK